MKDFISLFAVGIAHRHHPDKPTVSVIDYHRAHEDLFGNLSPTKRQAVIDTLYEQAEHFTDLHNAVLPKATAKLEPHKKGAKLQRSKAEIASRYAQFIALARGIPAQMVAQALTARVQDMELTNCTKNHMAREWADGRECPQLSRLTSGQLDGLFTPLREKI